MQLKMCSLYPKDPAAIPLLQLYYFCLGLLYCLQQQSGCVVDLDRARTHVQCTCSRSTYSSTRSRDPYTAYRIRIVDLPWRPHGCHDVGWATMCPHNLGYQSAGPWARTSPQCGCVMINKTMGIKGRSSHQRALARPAKNSHQGVGALLNDELDVVGAFAGASV